MDATEAGPTEASGAETGLAKRSVTGRTRRPLRQRKAAVAGLLALAVAAASVPLWVSRTERLAPLRSGDFEAGFSGWDFGGPDLLPDQGSEVTRDTTTAYEGAASARASIPAGDGNKYARTIWGGFSGRTGELNLVDGDDFTYGVAILLPAGFHDSVQSYFVPVRWDNFGVAQPSRSGLAMYADGELRLVRERDGVEKQVDLLGDTSFRLSEEEWHWLEVRQRLSARDGEALNELRVDGDLIGTSTARNYYGEPVGALRFGIVAIGGDQDLPLTVFYDRAILSRKPIGPVG